MDGNHIERVSQETKCGKSGNGSLLDEASDVARGVLESIQALAGTTTCKGVQISQLKKWAIDNQHWITDADTLGTFSDRGSENEVYLSFDERWVYKLNDFRYSDDNLSPFFDRMLAHNQYFPDCAYSFIGFAANRDGSVCAVLKQPLIVGAREASEAEIAEELEKRGFKAEDDGAYFSNGIHDLFDAVPNNVLADADGRLFFIDTIIFPSGTDGLSTYNKYSPRTKR